MKLNDKLMLGFQENQSFLFVLLRNYQFMYTARDLLKAERKRGEEDAVRGGLNPRGARDGAEVRALASHQCGPGSNPGVDAICGLSLLLVLSFAPRGFSPGTPVFPSPQKPTLPNSNSIWNARTRLNEFI